ncbi:MAG: chromosomal replication initiator protein DnaA [Nevskiaceae bacterium]|nr:MAG: chromosomal replication initiator protein DnaA [Nevskiaceae bacterium]TBR72498.1 MAG: chromosomal replication initiator protein DnaA [Nevskiaceae bacterium]
MDDIWEPCLKRLENELDTGEVGTWIRPLRMLRNGAHITLLAPNRVVVERVRDGYMNAVRRQLSLLAGYDVSVDITIGNAAAPAGSSADTSGNDGTPFDSYLKGRLNPTYTFTSFVEGKSNSQARAASELVSANPGTSYNPLLIYGESGLGKTHLMHSIGNAILARQPDARIVYVGAEQWFNQMVSAIRYARQTEFKNFYRSVDTLLIDDIHFLAGKEHSQEEFFHTFNVLIDGHKQIVLTCDRYPRELNQLDDRLKSRFTWGLSVPIEPPDLETRVAILLNKAEVLGVHLPREVAMLVAQRIRTNVRELEGALHRLNASSKLTGQQITEEFARFCLRDMLATYDRQISIDSIKKCVAEHYKLRIADLSSKRRTRSVARPRQIAMALAKELTQHSYPEIGEAFNKDHTTVLHACRKVQELREADVQINEEYETLQRNLIS